MSRMAWDASGGAVRMRRRRGAICEAASAAPRAISFLSWQKRYGRKDRWNDFIALLRKKLFDSACHSPIARPVRNALRAAVESGFPIARCAVRVALFAPAEYLTYGIRTTSVLYKGRRGGCLHQPLMQRDDVGIVPYKCGALEVKSFLLRSLYWLRKRNEPNKKTKSQRIRRVSAIRVPGVSFLHTFF